MRPLAILIVVVMVPALTWLAWDPLRWERTINKVHADRWAESTRTDRSVLPPVWDGCRGVTKVYETSKSPREAADLLAQRLGELYAEVRVSDVSAIEGSPMEYELSASGGADTTIGISVYGGPRTMLEVSAGYS